MQYVLATELSDKLRQEITEIYPKIFGSFKEEKFFHRFIIQNKFLLLSAYKNDRLVGFKFGYAIDDDIFYSWSGGVVPEARRQGIAEELMRRQHDWCIQNKYAYIETRTRNKFPEMIALNVKTGFHIIGTFTESDGAPKIILRKKL